jgi:hypothetical protein
MDYVYFNGVAIKVATIGNEGMVGLAAFFGTEKSTDRMVQFQGDALSRSSSRN